MAKMLTLPPIPGVRDLQTLMAFLMNKDEYDARLDAMVDLQGEIQAMIGKYSAVKDVDALLSSAMQKDAEASTVLEAARLKAKSEALDIVQTAKAEADEKLKDAERIYQDTVAKMTQLVDDKEAFDIYKAEAEADLAQHMKACLSREAESERIKADVEAMQISLADKLAKLRAATEGV